MGPGGPGGPFGGGAQGFDFGSVFGDIFEEMFGAGGQRGRGGRTDMRGQDLRFNLEITLGAGLWRHRSHGARADVDRLRGLQGQRRGARLQAAAVPDLPWPRPPAGPAGLLHRRAHLPYLPRRGPGDRQAVPRLRRPGPHARATRRLKVNIPAGVEDGTRIRLSGEGEAGARGGPAGDLYVFLSVRRHQLFEREGADVHCRVPISMVQATLGGNIEVPTLDGKMARINIPAGAQGGHQFRLRGKGMPIVRSAQRGDMYIEINVETPTNLTPKQKELLKEFEKAGKTSPEIRRLLQQGEGDVRRPMPVKRISSSEAVVEVESMSSRPEHRGAERRDLPSKSRQIVESGPLRAALPARLA